MHTNTCENLRAAAHADLQRSNTCSQTHLHACKACADGHTYALAQPMLTNAGTRPTRVAHAHRHLQLIGTGSTCSWAQLRTRGHTYMRAMQVHTCKHTYVRRARVHTSVHASRVYTHICTCSANSWVTNMPAQCIPTCSHTDTHLVHMGTHMCAQCMD